ncbi:phage terminase small subunit P27 family [Mycobacterium intracellulare]|uniref:phage terminase small subunit P27 family n=1 Tax=Mycobacterium intracellulare TaxID=1767 RepID=UPI0015CBFA89|nr:phage terminase small subunit P27 family [Mycobacterium intracellulare]
MGKRGPAPAPAALKLLRGVGPGRDSGGRKVPTPPKFERSAPDCPDWLPPDAQDMWERTVPELERLDLLKEIDLGVLAAYCLAWDQLVQAVNAYQAQGFTTANKRSGRVTVNPVVATARAAMRDLLTLARELGCTPSAEANLATTMPADDEADDPFSS